MSPSRIHAHLDAREDRAAVRHLFLVASSLDSMVVGEPQILAQVKQAYQAAAQRQAAGPVIHGMFQAALKTARRVAHETALHQHRVSVPSVAIADFARQVFDRFDDKQTLVIGAGEMAEETLKYLRQQGAVRRDRGQSPHRAGGSGGPALAGAGLALGAALGSVDRRRSGDQHHRCRRRPWSRCRSFFASNLPATAGCC